VKRTRISKGSVEQLPSGRFRARKPHPITGKLVSCGTHDTETEAAHALTLPIDVPRKGLTLGSYWPKVLERRKKRVFDWKNDEGRWSLYVEQHQISKLPLREIKRRHLREWLDWMRDRGLASQTCKNALNLVRCALHDAVEDELIPVNPARDLRLHKSTEARSDDPWTILDPDEQYALLSAVDEDEWHTVAGMLGHGYRNSEQWRIPWDDVDIDAKLVTVRYSVGGKPPKGGRPRRLPLFGVAFEAYRIADERRKRGCKLVFPAPRTNERRADKSHPTRWAAWLERAGIKRPVRWYDLRHTCATSLLAGWWGEPWSLEEIQQLLGHASRTTTERYAHRLQETLVAAGRRVDFHALDDDGAKSGAGFGIRTRDLRFTNPQHLEGFSALAVVDFHNRSTARDSRLAAVVLDATREAFRMGRSPLAKARVHELLREGADLVQGGSLARRRA
jgi:integrase